MRTVATCGAGPCRLGLARCQGRVDPALCAKAGDPRFEALLRRWDAEPPEGPQKPRLSIDQLRAAKQNGG